MFIGYQNCKVLDIVNTRPCFNYGDLGHSSTECINDSKCLKYAGSHKTPLCKEISLRKCMQIKIIKKTMKQIIYVMILNYAIF